jgi:hypothetical protein
VLATAVIVLTISCSGSGDGSATLPSGVTRPPATEAPAGTDPPATEAPATEAPETEPPRTEAPETEPPATQSPDEEPETTEPADDESGSTTWWLWVLLGIAVVAIIAAIIVYARSRKSPQWPAQTAAILDGSDEITTHIVGQAPAGLSAIAGADAARLAGLMASVQQLVASAPDDASRRALAQVQDPLRSLHAALDTLGLRGTPPSEQETAEVAALWFVDCADLPMKVGFAEECGSAAAHHRALAGRLAQLGFEPFDPRQGGYSRFFGFLRSLQTPEERASAGAVTLRTFRLGRLALFAELCRERGDADTAALFDTRIASDERQVMETGWNTLISFSPNEECQARARRAAFRIVELAGEVVDPLQLRKALPKRRAVPEAT